MPRVTPSIRSIGRALGALVAYNLDVPSQIVRIGPEKRQVGRVFEIETRQACHAMRIPVQIQAQWQGVTTVPERHARRIHIPTV